MKITCPECQAVYNLPVKNLNPGPKLVRCGNCKTRFQVVMPGAQPAGPSKTSDPVLSMKEMPCPFCSRNVPVSAVRCRYCGQFKKKARLTIEKVRDEKAAQDAVSEFLQVCPGMSMDFEKLFRELPKKFQLDYSAALKLKVNLQNKGVTLRVEEGVDLPPQTASEKASLLAAPVSDNSEPTHSETVYSKVTFEQVLKDMKSRSSIEKELFGNLFVQRRELFVIIMIAFIPFLSLNLDNSYQLLFYPTFLGMLWAFIVFSFFGDGNVPIRKAVLYFIFSGTGGALLAVIGNKIIGRIFDFLPKMLFYILVVGIVEEAAKLMPILRIIRKPSEDRLIIRYIDIMVLSLICGIGFSASENILYKFRIDEIIGAGGLLTLDVSRMSNIHFLRTISLPILHGSWTALFGVISFYGFTIGKTRKYVIIGLSVSAILHGLYDTISYDSLANYLIVFISFVLILVLYSLCTYIDQMKYREIQAHTTRD